MPKNAEKCRTIQKDKTFFFSIYYIDSITNLITDQLYFAKQGTELLKTLHFCQNNDSNSLFLFTIINTVS